MIIIGHKLIPFTPFYKISSITDIDKTAPNSVVLFDFSNEEILKYVQEQNLTFALYVKNLKEACLANALKTRFLIITNKQLAKNVQNIATEYLFDSKILVCIEDEESIEDAAKDSIDGVLFNTAIKTV